MYEEIMGETVSLFVIPAKLREVGCEPESRSF
jgi:hypothetical protein